MAHPPSAVCFLRGQAAALAFSLPRACLLWLQRGAERGPLGNPCVFSPLQLAFAMASCRVPQHLPAGPWHPPAPGGGWKLG